MAESILDKVSNFLSFGSNAVIGIDIGSSMIKMVELEKFSGDNYKISNYASITLVEGTIIDDEIQNEDELLKALRLCLKKLNSKRKFACIGVSGPSTAMKKLQIPQELSIEEQQDQAEWDIEQYLPFTLEEANISCSLLKENTGSMSEFFVAAAKKILVNSYKTTIEKTNLKVKIVDLSSAAVLNVFELILAGNLTTRNANWLLLEIGAVKSKFIVYKNGYLNFFKEINIGGNTITEEIQRAMGVTYNEAQSLKTQGDGNGNIPEEVLEIINQVVLTFVAEIITTREFWSSSTGDNDLDGCALTGGGALIPDISEQLAEALETEVTTLNPFSKMTYNKNIITEEMITEIAYQGVCAIGLAMRSIAK